MLLGVISDTHDNLPKTAAAVDLFARRKVGHVVHAGDFVAPFTVRLLVGSGLPLTGVFGNNDGERAGLKKACAAIYEPPRRLVLGGRTIVLAHDPEQLEGAGEGADVLIYGHTHAPCVEQGSPLRLNPGEAGGWLSGRSTVAIVDLAVLTAELVDLGAQETVKL